MKKKKTSKSPVVKVPWLESEFDTENGTLVHPNLLLTECIEHVPSAQNVSVLTGLNNQFHHEPGHLSHLKH